MTRGWNRNKGVAVAIAEADSGEVVLAEFVTGTAFIPAGSTITTLTFYAAVESGGTYLPLYDDGLAVTLSVAAGQSHRLPVALAGAVAIKLVGDAAGTVDISWKG